MSDGHIFLKKDDTPGGPGFCMLLGNFGNAKIQENSAITQETFTISDEYYLSYENIERCLQVDESNKESQKKEKRVIKPSKQCDIFAAGIMLMEICAGRRPGDESKDFMLVNEADMFQEGKTAMDQVFKDYPGGDEFTTYIKERILVKIDQAAPLCSTVFQECKPVKEMARKLINEDFFKKEMKERLRMKMAVGWASQQE